MVASLTSGGVTETDPTHSVRPSKAELSINHNDARGAVLTIALTNSSIRKYSPQGCAELSIKWSSSRYTNFDVA